MSLTHLPPDHNDTVECFARHSTRTLSAEIVIHIKEAHAWLLMVLVCAFMVLGLVVFLPPVKAKPVEANPVPAGQTMLMVPAERVHKSALKACPPKYIPVWLNALDMQCLKEIK